jgi:hypothetical protein
VAAQGMTSWLAGRDATLFLADPAGIFVRSTGKTVTAGASHSQTSSSPSLSPPGDPEPPKRPSLLHTKPRWNVPREEGPPLVGLLNLLGRAT